jgi:hypothetical protein
MPTIQLPWEKAVSLLAEGGRKDFVQLGFQEQPGRLEYLHTAVDKPGGLGV